MNFSPTRKPITLQIIQELPVVVLITEPFILDGMK